MKKLSFEEFNQKSRDIIRARKIFIKSCVTNNLTVAYELYKELLAEQEDHYDFFTNFVPACPQCGNKNVKRYGGCGHFEKHEFCTNCNYERILDGGE